jgi:hypothetical protein
MTPTLSSVLNKTVLVAIPTLFGDARARSCRLVAAETQGLWLISDELSARVLPDAKGEKSSAGPAVFVPFAQIAAVVPLTPPSTSVGLKPASAASAKPAPKAAAGPAKTNPPSAKASGPAGA